MSSFHVPEPPEDVSVLFMDETDCQESSSMEKSLMKEQQQSMGVELMRKSMARLKFTDPHSSSALNSPGAEEGGNSSRKETKSDSFSSEATILYPCSNGEEGERERSASLGKVNADMSPSLSCEASGPKLSSEGEKDAEEMSTSPERITHDYQSLSSNVNQCLTSSGEEQESKTISPPVRVLSQSGHCSEASGGSSPESSAASGGMAKGISNKVKTVRKEQEMEKQEEDEGSAKPEPQFKVGYQYRTVERQLMQNEVSILIYTLLYTSIWRRLHPNESLAYYSRKICFSC